MASFGAAAQGVERPMTAIIIDEGEQSAVERLIRVAGDNPGREELHHTPRRYLQALRELTEGAGQDPEEILSQTFEMTHDSMIVVGDMEFWSLCEHHLLPFHGMAAIGYLPDGKVLGLSKLARLLYCFSRRLQIQERMTEQIAKAIQECLIPRGVGVIVRADHSCMRMRGVRTSARTTTSCLLGAFREDRVKEEFLGLSGML